MIELTSTQTTILQTAADRHDRAILPLPENIRGGAVDCVIDSLKSKGLANQLDGDDGPLVVTTTGLIAIGREMEDSTTEETPSKPRRSRANSKQAKVIDMMRQPDGATLAQIVDATTWQPHSVRGFISGVVRKKLGLDVISENDQDGNRVYRINPAQPME